MNDLLDVKSALEHSVPSADYPRFAAVDIDNTCIEKDVAEATLAYMCEHRLILDSSLLPDEVGNDTDYEEQVFRYYYFLLSTGHFRDAYRLCAKIFAGYSLENFSEIVRLAIAAEGPRVTKRELFGVSIERGLRMRPAVRELLIHIAQLGIEIFIVSASPAVAVRTAMQHFNIPGNLLAVRTQLNGSVQTSILIEPAPIAEQKVSCIKHFVHPTTQPLFAIGDSMNDFSMLQYATIRLVIDRNNLLSSEARRLGWHLYRT